ncbi:MAG TPA: hypothetical protein VHO25_19500 [Polyangiaceae bacterium]|nr:hypothetical protein [Polyangiaceae bacterium]
MDPVAREMPPEMLVEFFDEGFAAMWLRAHRTLGDITLTAITDRVLRSAAERFPAFSALTVDGSGLQCKDLRERAAGSTHDQVADGMRFVLVEFLTILGNLTANVLTPALHAELSKVVPKKVSPGDSQSPGATRSPQSSEEGSNP